MAGFEMWLLGSPRLEGEGEPLEIETRKAMALLVYLAVTGTGHSRDALATLLWPDHDQQRARAYLRRALWTLNNALPEACLAVDRKRVSLVQSPDIWIDVQQFQQLLAVREAHNHQAIDVCADCLPPLSQAVELYRDDFLMGFTLSDCRDFDEWQFFQTESLRQQLATALECLTQAHSDQGDFESAITHARRRLGLDPEHEPAHRQLMQLYARAGQQAAALRQYGECVRVLAQELGVPPSAQTTELYEAIKEMRAASSSPPPDPPARPPSFLDEKSQPPELERAVFIGRERELARLDAFLAKTLAGRRQVAFVIGGAGRGKTSLLNEFTHRAQAAHADLIVVSGDCNIYTGVGDPYLPFRDILGMLAGSVETRWAAGTITRDHALRLWHLLPYAVQALVDHGPTLIDTFIPVRALMSRARAYASDKAGWLDRLQNLTTLSVAQGSGQGLDQSHIFDDYTAVLEALAARRPLLLILDDLHWADVSSISLLFHLSRRLEESRVMIVGAYRQDDISPSWDGEEHPLKGVLSEFKRLFGDIWLDLGQAEQAVGREFVDALLDTEPNRLDDHFRQELTRHTRGHPLFTVELLRDMQERGALWQDDQGRWVAGPRLGWDTLPARVEGVIEKRMDRLDSELREALTVASVEGEAFTAEVIARILSIDGRALVRQLSGRVDKQHRLVEVQGIRQLNGHRLSTYRFRHILFQKYLYNSLDEVELAYRHEAVGNELEALYGDQAEEIAVQLARHFQVAALKTKAIDYLSQAGKRALRLSANKEAIAHFSEALQLLQTLPNRPARAQQELELQTGLGPALIALKGYAAPEVERAYARARVLCQEMGDTPLIFRVLAGLSTYYYVRADLRQAYELGQQILQLAQREEDTAVFQQAYRTLGATLCAMGDFASSQACCEQGIMIYAAQPARDAAPLHYGQDPGVICLSFSSLALWFLGYPDQALRRTNEALALAEELAHPFSLAFALGMASFLHHLRREEQTAQERAELAFELATEKGFIQWIVQGNIEQGWALVEQEQQAQGLAQMRQALQAWQATGAELLRPYFLLRLAKAYGKANRSADGLTVLAEALAAANKSGERWVEAEMVRLKGEFLAWQGEDEQEVEACFRQALDIARQQGAKSLELRAAMSLSRQGQQQGNNTAARQLLAEIYNWFTEGFDTADLQEARSLLEALS